MHDLAFLLFRRSVIPHHNFLAGTDFHGQRNQRAMRVHFERGSVFGDGHAIREFRGDFDLNFQKYALRAAFVSGAPRALGRHTGHEAPFNNTAEKPASYGL